MLKKREAKKILEREYDYEDNIMDDLTITFIAAIPKISGLSKKEKDILNKKLSLIRDESRMHKESFKKLLEYIDKNVKDNY